MDYKTMVEKEKGKVKIAHVLTGANNNSYRTDNIYFPYRHKEIYKAKNTLGSASRNSSLFLKKKKKKESQGQGVKFLNLLFCLSALCYTLEK